MALCAMFTRKMIFKVFYAVIIFVPCLYAKIDHISLKDDQRDGIHLVSFGMYDGGFLRVNLSVNYTADSSKTENNKNTNFGLTIDKTTQSSPKVAQYGESRADIANDCSLRSTEDHEKSISLHFMINTTARDGKDADPGSYVLVKKGLNMVGVELSTDSVVPPTGSGKKDTDKKIDIGSDQSRTAKKNNSGTEHDKGSVEKEDDQLTVTPDVKLLLSVVPDGQFFIFNVTFTLMVVNEVDAGEYSIFFHNCRRTANGKEVVAINSLEAEIMGKNTKPLTFLSAGDIPEPYLFFTVAIVYVILSVIWLRVLRNSSSGVFKTHYLMLSLCYCKALSALFHGVNFYYIGIRGKEETAWAVIFYISYLMKTVMLFLTIMLVGTGWAFIKHIFSDREKKLFLVAIPLQVLVYVSHVIMSETEVATKAYSSWRTISYIVDLLCCAAILLPVIWSIRHLTEASQTNGKAALNLQKLRLFKSLYVMVIAYIYITRIVILVFKFTLPYQLTWLGDFFTEATVLLFLTTMGYKFRPSDDNPYFQVPPDSDDEEEHEEMAVTQSGLSMDAKRRNLTVSVDAEDIEKQSLLPTTASRRNNESSHDLD